MKYLSDIMPDEVCIIEKILTIGNMKRRFTDIGLIEGTKVECVGTSPSGNPKAFLIRGGNCNPLRRLQSGHCEVMINGTYIKLYW